MPPTLNETELDAKLTELEKARTWTPRVVSKLEALLRSDDDFDLFRMNPLTFAAERGVDEQEAIDLFLHGCRGGIFQMNWGIVCPSCGDLLQSFRSLKTLHNNYTCGMCHIKGTADLDDFIQVSFTVSPLIRNLTAHHPESLSPEAFHFKYHFAREARGGPGGPRIAEWMQAAGKLVMFLPPRSTETRTIDVTPGFLLGWDLTRDHGFMFSVDEGATGHALTVTLADDRYAPENGNLAPGALTLTFENRMETRGAMMLANLPPDHFSKKSPVHLDPFLTGRRLIANQTFRDLYRTETIGGQEGIGVKDTSLLFTDLKGSTEMYDKIGDLKAFSLVRQHFDRLGKAVFRNAGAVVKTIGDAVMATFNTPAGAVSAALMMLDEIDAFNKEHGDQALVLKIGVHHGASIAVTLNDRLDYFGQTVNIAARVQGLAGAEEIYITEDVQKAPGVTALLARYDVVPQLAALKGVAGQVKVFRITEKGRTPAPAAAKPAPAPAAKAKAKSAPKSRKAATKSRRPTPNRKPARR